MIVRKNGIKKASAIFAVTLIIIVAMFAAGVIKTDRFNKTKHHETLAGEELFGDGADSSKDLSFKAIPREGAERIFL